MSDRLPLMDEVKARIAIMGDMNEFLSNFVKNYGEELEEEYRESERRKICAEFAHLFNLVNQSYDFISELVDYTLPDEMERIRRLEEESAVDWSDEQRQIEWAQFYCYRS